MTDERKPEADGGSQAIRDEMSTRLRALAGSPAAGESVKSQILRATRRLAHPQLTASIVKRLWYGEIRIVPAHLADHIRAAGEPRSEEGFIIDADGHVRARAGNGIRHHPVAVGFGRETVTIELRPSTVSAGGLGTLRNWLLSMISDPRGFRVVDVDRATLSPPSNALKALDRIEEAMKETQGRYGSLVHGMAMIADENGVRELNEAVLAELGISPESSCDVALYLARNLDVVVFQPIGGRTDVLARARGTATRAVIHARAWLACQTAPARLRIHWGEGWLSEPVPDGSIAAARLMQLVHLDHAGQKQPLYLAERIELDDVPAREMEPLRPMLSVLSRGFNQHTFNELMDRRLAHRLWAVGIDGGRATFKFVPVGPDYYGKSFAFDAVGQRVADQPDGVYGRAVEKALVEAASFSRPYFERVRARIREHGDDGTPGVVRIARYGRLVVPIDAKRVVTVSSLTPPPAVAA